MKQVMNYHKDNGLLNMIRRTDPMIKRFILIINLFIEMFAIYINSLYLCGTDSL